jgi:hypothetical protein
MSRLWDRIFKLDYELSIWVEEEELGKEKLVYHKLTSWFSCSRWVNFNFALPETRDLHLDISTRKYSREFRSSSQER